MSRGLLIWGAVKGRFQEAKSRVVEGQSSRVLEGRAVA